MEEKRWISSKELFSVILELLAEKKRAAFTITGMSMWPLLCHGRDQVILEAVDSRNVKKGDIVLLHISDSRYILHRITKVDISGIETTGDGNCFRDGMFPYEYVVARAPILIRNGKKIDCGKLGWRIIFRIWMLLFPIRKYIFEVWSGLRKYVRKS